MKYILFLLILFPLFATAQIYYPNGSAYDSTTFTFSDQDTLSHYMTAEKGYITIDTTSSTLWQIGNTNKHIFSGDTTFVRGIMTDTLQPYPKNANDYFILKIDALIPNFIVDFWHKYETDNRHAGGIVEFSTDSGKSWMNVVNCPNIHTQNMYSYTDTLFSGEPAFSGTSDTEQLSRIQVINCELHEHRLTSTNCITGDNFYNLIYLRFRFLSDTTVDTLSGWIIDSIKIEDPGCILGGAGYISNENKLDTISLFPNPSTSSLTIMSSDKITGIAISNLIGQTIYTQSYDANTVQVDVSDLPAGVYLIRINGIEIRKFVKR